MYKVNAKNQSLTILKEVNFTETDGNDHYNIRGWLEKAPDILGEKLLIIGKNYRLSSGRHVDLLALDRQGNVVIIELKRDSSVISVDWQSVIYAAYFADFTSEDICHIYADYLRVNTDSSGQKSEATSLIKDFLGNAFERLNSNQRLLLVAKDFHVDLISSALWLHQYGVDITCINLVLFSDADNNLFIDTHTVIPLSDAEDYLQHKKTQAKERPMKPQATAETELPPDMLKMALTESLDRSSEFTPRLVAFLEALLEENKAFDREEIKEKLYGLGIARNPGSVDRLLNSISRFLNQKSNQHFRQIISVQNDDSLNDGGQGFRINDDYRDLLKEVLGEME